MRKINITIILLIQIFYGCHPSVTSNNTKLQFTIKKFDFGEINIEDEANCTFEFINTGKKPLVIQNVKTSCGCANPTWPMKPIKPGEREKIQINYDTSFPGMFSKTISVYYNGTSSPETLTIKGNVRLPSESDF